MIIVINGHNVAFLKKVLQLAIFVDSLSTCLVEHMNFNNNGANRGGAIATFRGGELTIHESDFYQNSGILHPVYLRYTDHRCAASVSVADAQ